MSAFEAAVQSHVAGLAVVPLWPLLDGGCGCPLGDACTGAGKHPRGGSDSVLEGLDEITAHWETHPDDGLAINVAQSGLVVIDVDSDQGDRAVVEILGEHSAPFRCEVITGRGRHLWFRGNASEVTASAGLGFEVKTKGIVVAPPSPHRSGVAYRWADGCHPGRIPDLPAGLRRAIGEVIPGPTDPTSSWLDTFVASPEPITAGGRHDALVRLAGALRRGGTEGPALAKQLRVVNRARLVPPLPESEVRQIVKSAIGWEPKPGAEETTRLEFATIDDLLAEPAVENEWIWEGYIAASAVTGIAAAPKAGKSTLLGDLVRAVVRGEDTFLGSEVTKASVVVVSEERKSDLRSRYADCAGLGVHILGREMLFSQGMPPWAAIVSQSCEYAVSVGARLIIFDTLRGLAQVEEENDGKKMTDAVKELQQASAHGLATVIVHHTRKTGGSRGSGAAGSNGFVGALDMLLTMTIEGDDESPDRRIEAIGRWDAPLPIICTRKEGRYVSLGDVARVRARKLSDQVLRVLPPSPTTAADLRAALASEGVRVGVARLRECLTELTHMDRLVQTGTGKSGDPFRWSNLSPGIGVGTDRTDIPDEDQERWEALAA